MKPRVKATRANVEIPPTQDTHLSFQRAEEDTGNTTPLYAVPM
jgi:hypothetical protein